MVMEIVGADVAPGQAKDGIEGDNGFLLETENQTKTNTVQAEEATKSVANNSHGVNEETKEVGNSANTNVPKDAAAEWPAPAQVHTFYFVKVRTYDDPKLKLKIDQAERETQRRIQARHQIFDALKTKRSERAEVISQLKPLGTEDKHFRMVMDEKRKEMEPLQNALGKLRNANNTVREKGVGLCSSEEELNSLIQSLQYRIQHESNTLVEEKQFLKEIKQLEGTRDKVIANAAMRAKLQDSLGQKEAIQDQVKLIGGDLDGVRKEQQSVRTKIRALEEQLKVIDDEISSLQEDLTAATEKKDKAFDALNELKKVRDEANACFYQNRSLLTKAKDLAVKKDIAALEGLSHSEAEKFMSQWNSSKVFRDDYERRILVSLDGRQLSRDGRMRNPDEKPIISEAPAVSVAEPAPPKVSVKQTKDIKPPVEPDTISAHKAVAGDLVKSVKVEKKGKVGGTVEDTGNSSETATEVSQKEMSKSKEINAAKLKEIKREEEIAKAKLASERKKRLAEKASAKAAARAQKDAEKKLKEKEKRARKKAGASASGIPADQIDTDAKAAETEEEEADLKTETPVIEKKEDKEKVRFRKRAKPQVQLPRSILKKKKSHSYWLWAVPAVILALVLGTISYYYSLSKN